jgi:large subunit ribosomal protein L22
MEVKAYARYIRMTPRKVRLVAALIRGMDVARAEAQLRFYRKAAARPVLKLLLSAVANAEHNFKITDGLYVKKITVDGGPALKRWRARAFGRAAGIKKRMSHINLVLDQRTVVNAAKGSVAAAVVADKDEAKVKKAAAKSTKAKKTPAKKSKE